MKVYINFFFRSHFLKYDALNLSRHKWSISDFKYIHNKNLSKGHVTNSVSSQWQQHNASSCTKQTCCVVVIDALFVTYIYLIGSHYCHAKLYKILEHNRKKRTKYILVSLEIFCIWRESIKLLTPLYVNRNVNYFPIFT